MSHHATHGHDSHHAHATGDRPYFPAAEWERFQHEDIAVGKTIIILMSAIFSVGLVLYSIVALTVAAG